MTIGELVVAVIWIAGLLVAAPQVRHAWSGEGLAKVERIWRSFWPYSEAALQGWLRAQVPLYLAACFMAAYPAATLLPAADRPARFLLALVTLVGITGAVLMIAVAVAAVFFNRPKRFVFPRLRDQEGLLSHWRQSRRRRSPDGDDPT